MARITGFAIASALLATLTVAVACGADPAPAAAAAVPPAVPAEQPESERKLRVVTTSNIVADWVRQVGQDRVVVDPLLPSNVDPHAFQPGARDITRVADADLVLTVGLGLEAGWLADLVKNAAREPGEIVALGESVDPIEFMDMRGHEDDEHDEDDHGALDPHFWFDPLRVKRAVNDIAARLSVMDSENRDFYRANANEYSSELDELHSWIEERVATVPSDRRVLVTSHDSFRYFATAYGFEVVGAVSPGGTTEREPSAREMAELIDDIRDAGAPAVFTEATVSDKIAQRIAQEVGAAVVTGLYTGSLGEPEGDAGTYMDFIRYNVAIIVAALK